MRRLVLPSLNFVHDALRLNSMRFNSTPLALLASFAALGFASSASAEEVPPPAPTAPVDLNTAPGPVLSSPASKNAALPESDDLDAAMAPAQAPAAPQKAPEPTSPAPPPTSTADTATPPSIAPVSSADSSGQSGGQSSSEAVDTPRYTFSQPTYAVSLMGTLSAASIPFLDTNGTASTQKLRGISLGLEFQPEFLQSVGVLGFGPNLSYFFTSEVPDQVTAGGFAVYSIGGEIRYQARFFHEQFLVPFVGYEMESMAYRLKNFSGSLSINGLAFGGMLLLNALEPEAAGTFYSDQGVSRSYLVAEWRGRSGSDKNLTFSGNAFFFGLRIEF